jgi:hypothetical protein
MRKLLGAAALISAASLTTFAIGQVPPRTTTPPESFDARTLASDEEVAEARRYYRAECEEHQSREFCECVTAGVAQALMPAEVRIAGRTIGERINAEGDLPPEFDGSVAESSSERIARVEAHYANTCMQFRR